VADPGRVTRVLQALSTDIPDDRALAERICLACTDGLDIDGAAISLMTASAMRETLFASDPTASLLDELQFTLGEGPCIEAATSGRPVLVPDVDDVVETSRWPVYSNAVVERTDVRAIFALPLQWGTINLGVLDMYRRAPGSLSRVQLGDAMSVADTAALMLLDLRTDPDQDRRDENRPGAGARAENKPRDRSWGNRTEVHQATGMIVAQLGISASDAFARLRAHAFTEQRLLTHVARDVVGRHLHFTKET